MENETFLPNGCIMDSVKIENENQENLTRTSSLSNTSIKKMRRLGVDHSPELFKFHSLGHKSNRKKNSDTIIEMTGVQSPLLSQDESYKEHPRRRPHLLPPPIPNVPSREELTEFISNLTDAVGSLQDIEVAKVDPKFWETSESKSNECILSNSVIAEVSYQNTQLAPLHPSRKSKSIGNLNIRKTSKSHLNQTLDTISSGNTGASEFGASEQMQTNKPKERWDRANSGNATSLTQIKIPTINIEDVSQSASAHNICAQNTIYNDVSLESYASSSKGSFKSRKDSLVELVKRSPKLRKRFGKKKHKKSSLNLRDQTDNDSDTNEKFSRKSIFQAIEERFKIAAKSELKIFYTNLRINLPIHQLKNHKYVSVENIFVEPTLTFNKNIVKIEDLLTVQPNKVSANPIIIVKGGAGFGKTALCHYITHCWKQGNDRIKELSDVDVLFTVECRYVSNSGVMPALKSIYLKDSVGMIPPSKDDYLIFKLLNNMNTMFLLDGFDEIQDSCRDLLKKIRSRLPESKIVITTRLYGIKDVEETLDLDISCDCIEFILKGFDEVQLVELIVNVAEVYEKSDDEQVSLLNYIEDNLEKLQPVLNVPLHIVLFLVIWIQNAAAIDKIRTATDLFREIVELMKQQLFQVLGLAKYVDAERGKDLIDAWMKEIGRVALYCIHARQFYFAPLEYDTIKRYSTKLKINHYIAFPVIMQQVEHLSIRNLRAFLHTSIMEYLAAIYMDYTIATSQAGVFDLISRTGHSERNKVSCGCIPLSPNFSPAVSNIDKRNYQLDSTINFLVNISLENGHNSEKLGEEAATYFSMRYNRNLITLSSFVSLFRNNDDPFKKGLKNALSKQTLPNPINNWNLKHVINLIKNEALKPSVLVKFSVENKDDWGTTVNEFVRLGCRPFIKVILEQTEQMQALLHAIHAIEKPQVPKLIFQFGFIEAGIKELVEIWPYPKPMHIMSVEGNYAIESYLACVAIVSCMGFERVKRITFTGDEASYIFGLLKMSLPGITIHLESSTREKVHIVIAVKY